MEELKDPVCKECPNYKDCCRFGSLEMCLYGLTSEKNGFKKNELKEE